MTLDKILEIFLIVFLAGVSMYFLCLVVYEMKEIIKFLFNSKKW